MTSSSHVYAIKKVYNKGFKISGQQDKVKLQLIMNQIKAIWKIAKWIFKKKINFKRIRKLSLMKTRNQMMMDQVRIVMKNQTGLINIMRITKKA